jgi:PAS domain S-box-containing protein
MKKIVSLLILVTISLQSIAVTAAPFKNPDGSTKWQHIANFSSSVLILTLLVVAIFLFLANRRAARSNRELTEIKSTLEDRVERRTASLQKTTAQLQNREAYIASIVDSMPLMLIGLNHKLEITQWNRIAEAVTGRPIADVLGKNLWEAYPAITLTPEQINEVLTQKESVNIKHSQRGQYHFDFTLYALMDKSETGIVILVDDITKQVKAENKLAERDKMSAMGELASAMAFDINSPLSNILSTVKELQIQLPNVELGKSKDTLQQTLETAQQSGQQATAIVQNLLTLASSHNEQKQLLDVSHIMESSIELASRLFANASGFYFKHITIERSYSTSLPKVPCIASELEQVFVRLLRHAFYALSSADHHSREKHSNNIPTIQIEIGDFYDSLWIRVQHHGKVLTELEQQDIFQPFFSIASDAPACPVEHRLSYSYYIVTDHHQGQMAVTSDQLTGTVFNIQLPVK